LRHSHVFGETLCFSLVPDFRDYFEGSPSTAFWNPARTVKTFLEDLHLFLTVDQDKHCAITPADSLEAKKTAGSVNCECSHCAVIPWPPVDSWLAAEDSDDDGHASRSSVVGNAGSSHPSDTMTELCCGMTGVRWDVPGIVLGFGINCETSSRGRMSISSDFEPLSHQIFTDGNIRLSTLGNPITHFLPFAINREHWQRFGGLDSGSVLASTVAQLAPSKSGSVHDQLFFVLGELWKSKVVEMMRGSEHCSEKVLKGFCAIHHLFLSADADAKPTGDDRALPNPPAAPVATDVLTDKRNFIKEKIKAKKTPTPAQVGEFLRGTVRSLVPDMKKLPQEVSGLVRQEFDAIGWDCRQNQAKGPCPSPAQMLHCFSESLLHLKKWETSCASGPGDDDGEWSSSTSSKKKKAGAKKAMLASESAYVAHATKRVSSFMGGKSTKKEIPDFGSFLPLLLLSKLKWETVKLAFVKELLCRNALWVVKSHPKLTGNVTSSVRCIASWDPSAVGLRLTAFQVCFLLNCPKWASHEAGVDENQRTFRMYERLGGRPSDDMILGFQKDAKVVQGLANYVDFFKLVKIPLAKGEAEVGALLEDAMKKSASLGYHGRSNRR
jgi:hypothetical protein